MLEYSELSVLRKPFDVVLYVAKILVAYPVRSNRKPDARHLQYPYPFPRTLTG